MAVTRKVLHFGFIIKPEQKCLRSVWQPQPIVVFRETQYLIDGVA